MGPKRGDKRTCEVKGNQRGAQDSELAANSNFIIHQSVRKICAITRDGRVGVLT